MRSERFHEIIETPYGGTIKLCASVFYPVVPSSAMVFFCLPGGGASHQFFNLGRYDNIDYSFVSRMTALGHTVVTMDHPGTGANTLSSDHPFLTPRLASDYIALVFADFIQNFDTEISHVIGLGHSMGGMTTVLIQARHNLFDGVALLGSSTGGLLWGLDDLEKTYIGKPEEVEKDLEALVMRKFKSQFVQATNGPSGKSITFGGSTENVTNRLREISTSLYAAGGMMSMIQGSFIEEAEAVNVPLFFAFGDHDIGEPPKDAPKAFKNAINTELHILENCGHNSLAFPVIENLCEKLNRWLSSI